MRLFLPAHYGYSMPMASPKGAMPPSSMTPAHYIMAFSKEQCRSLWSSLVKQVFNIQHFIIQVAMVPSAYYYIPISALLI
jgi:hypothetical protein